MTDVRYITTPIYYANARPHLGTLYTSVAADVMARFYRLKGAGVKFLTGTDEHGQKVAEAAEALGQSPQAYVDDIVVAFQQLLDKYDITHDDFLRTTQERHHRAAQALWRKMRAAGDIYLGTYEGWYAVRDEAFYTEEEIQDGKAPTGNPVTWVREPCYFFKLSAYREKLIDHFQAHPEAIQPSYRRNEVLRFLENPVHDLCVSRTSTRWGVPVPDDEAHVMYVWVDALSNYLTTLGYPDETPDLATYWPQAIHLVGKDILRFHSVYWPALLMSAGLTPPKTVFAHGWWTREGQKMSKSLGNVVDPIALCDTFGSDQVRYFLIREASFGRDADFSEAALKRRINTDLANDYGNLCQRVLSFVHKHCNAQYPERHDLTEADRQFLANLNAMPEAVESAVAGYHLHKAAESIFEQVRAANRYVDHQAPWALRKSDPQRMQTVLSLLLEAIYTISIVAQCFIPKGAGQVLDFLGVGQKGRQLKDLNIAYADLAAQAHLIAPQPIFPRV